MSLFLIDLRQVEIREKFLEIIQVPVSNPRKFHTFHCAATRFPVIFFCPVRVHRYEPHLVNGTWVKLFPFGPSQVIHHMLYHLSTMCSDSIHRRVIHFLASVLTAVYYIKGQFNKRGTHLKQFRA